MKRTRIQLINAPVRLINRVSFHIDNVIKECQSIGASWKRSNDQTELDMLRFIRYGISNISLISVTVNLIKMHVHK